MTTNTTGIGARVVVTAGGEKLTKELGGGYGHMAMRQRHRALLRPGRLRARSNAVDVTWPNQARTTDHYEAVTVDRLVELRQGDATVYDATPKP